MNARSLRRLFLCTSVSLTAPLVEPQPLWSQVSSSQVAPINTYNAIHHPIVGRRGMVASQNSEATRVGVEILRRGGNAVDAAVGVGLALTVTVPRAGNLGGGGFMLVHLADGARTIAVDFRETAPAAAFAEMYFGPEGEVDQDEYRFTHKSSGVPGKTWRRISSWSGSRCAVRIKDSTSEPCPRPVQVECTSFKF